VSASGWRLALRGLSNYPLHQRPLWVVRRFASRTLDALGLRHPWVKHRQNPASPRRLEDFRLFAILGTWMEADVVEATVKNAFAQGCERVFLVDNDSPDDTVQTAIGAGAELVRSFSTIGHDEQLRIGVMNEAVSRISTEDGSEHIWWLWFDADEFPHGPRGLTVREYLATLDGSFRIVGARYFNHYPSSEPHYVPGFHPLDFQPLAEELPTRYCWLWHRKHPLQRFDRDGPAMRSDGGFHRAESSERPLLEPREPIFVHHFPFREQKITLDRLNALVSKNQDGTSRVDPYAVNVVSPHMLMRRRSVEAVYAGDWHGVELELGPPACRRPRVEPLPWTELGEPEHLPVKRWYAHEDIVGGVGLDSVVTRAR
jgi:hypothetical protein